MQNNNKSKIDKLKNLDKSLEGSKQVQAKTDDVQYRSPKEEWKQSGLSDRPNKIVFPLNGEAPYRINVDAIIKLNEELTSENARLINRLDIESKVTEQLFNTANSYSDKITNLKDQLSTIKSKWWYKLITWGW